MRRKVKQEQDHMLLQAASMQTWKVVVMDEDLVLVEEKLEEYSLRTLNSIDAAFIITTAHRPYSTTIEP